MVEEAAAAGSYCTAHAYTAAAIRRAVECGVRAIDHGNCLDEETAGGWPAWVGGPGRARACHPACRPAKRCSAPGGTVQLRRATNPTGARALPPPCAHAQT